MLPTTTSKSPSEFRGDVSSARRKTVYCDELTETWRRLRDLQLSNQQIAAALAPLIQLLERV